jgi:hypothetical protein
MAELEVKCEKKLEALKSLSVEIKRKFWVPETGAVSAQQAHSVHFVERAAQGSKSCERQQ